MSELTDTGQRKAIAEAAATAALIGAEAGHKMDNAENSNKMKGIAEEVCKAGVAAHERDCLRGPLKDLQQEIAAMRDVFTEFKTEIKTELKSAIAAAKVIVAIIVFLLPALMFAAQKWAQQPQPTHKSQTSIIGSAIAAPMTFDAGR